MVKTYLLALLLIISSCGGGSNSSDNSVQNQDPTVVVSDPLSETILVTPEGDSILSSLAYKTADQIQGLSGVRPESFSEVEGKLFYYFTDSSRIFWMKGTYFPLDIFYLDKDLKIVDVVWNLPAYSGTNVSEIPRAPAITSRHVLEMKAGGTISSKLRPGDKLRWKSILPQNEVESQMRSNL